MMRDQAEQLRQAAQKKRVRQRQGGPANVPFMAAVTSGKGGVGKSCLAIALAHQLGQMGHSVLLVDASLFSPSLHVLANLSSPVTVQGLMQQKLINTQNIFTAFSEKVDILTNDEAVNRLNRQHIGSPSFLLELIFSRKTGHDVVIFDTHCGVDQWNLELLHACDTSLLLTTCEPTSIIESYTFLKNALPYLNKSTIQLVITQSLSKAQAAEAFEKLNLALAHFLKFSFSTYFESPFETPVKQEIIEQNPFWLSEKCHNFVHSADKIASHVNQIVHNTLKETLTLKDEVVS